MSPERIGETAAILSPHTQGVSPDRARPTSKEPLPNVLAGFCRLPASQPPGRCPWGSSALPSST